MNTLRTTTALAWFALAFASAHAHEVTAGPLTIKHPYALPMPPGSTTGGAYLADIVNRGPDSDTLIAATSPLAERVELHSMQMDGDVMRMRAVPSIAIASGGHVAMAPGGGYHLMLTGVRKPWIVGDGIPLQLQFEHAGRIDVVLKVQERGGASMAHPMPSH